MTMGTQRTSLLNFAGCRYLHREPTAADSLLTSVPVASRGHRNWSLDLSFQNRCDAHDGTLT
jgi:hypothetical protein